MLLYLFDFRKVFFKGASKSSTAFFTVYNFIRQWRVKSNTYIRRAFPSIQEIA